MMMLMMIDWKKILFEGESNPRPMSEAEAVRRLFKLDPLSYLWWWWLTKNLCQRCTYLHHKTNHWWWWWWWWWWWERLLKGYKRAPRRRVDHNGSGKMSREKVSFNLFSLLLWWNTGQVMVKLYRCTSVWWNHAHQKGQCKIIVCSILLSTMFKIKYLNNIYMQCIAFYWQRNKSCWRRWEVCLFQGSAPSTEVIKSAKWISNFHHCHDIIIYKYDEDESRDLPGLPHEYCQQLARFACILLLLVFTCADIL